MARRRRRDAAASRAAILAAAREVFAGRGFHGAGVEQIARKAGVAKGTVFLHFKSKENLLFSMVEGHFATIEKLYAEMVRPEMSARRQLEELAAVERWLGGEVTEFSRAMLSIWTGLPPALRRRLDTFIRKTYNLYLGRIAGLFRDFLGAGRVEGVSVEALAAAFMACLDGILIRTRVGKVSPPPAQVGRALKKVFIESLAPRARRKGARR